MRKKIPQIYVEKLLSSRLSYQLFLTFPPINSVCPRQKTLTHRVLVIKNKPLWKSSAENCRTTAAAFACVNGACVAVLKPHPQRPQLVEEGSCKKTCSFSYLFYGDMSNDFQKHVLFYIDQRMNTHSGPVCVHWSTAALAGNVLLPDSDLKR